MSYARAGLWTKETEDSTPVEVGVGAQFMCDYVFGGKPKAVCVEVMEPGDGKNRRPGKVRGRILQSLGAYYAGEEVIIEAWRAVPLRCIRKPRRGEAFIRVKTNFKWI